MKPLFIIIKKDGKLHTAINSQDVKSIHISAKNYVTVYLSHDLVDMPMSQYGIDKLRKEIRERYDIIKVEPRGISNGGGNSRGHSRRYGPKAHKNSVIEVYHDDDTTLVFPKALQSVDINNRRVTVQLFGEFDRSRGEHVPKTLRVELNAEPNPEALDQLLPCATEEA